ncbi:MAG: Pigment production hydroxylase [Microbacteriaceae bacterium]|nr:Pigment production hydroxylase [Microbacteriaceae bacterium]
MTQVTDARTKPGASFTKPGPDLLARARRISPLISDEANAGQAQGRLTDAAVAAIIDSELPWGLIPEEWGGLGGTDILDAMDAIEELAYADGSAGWVLMVYSFANSMVASVLDPETAEPLIGATGRGMLCGQAAPLGKAVRVDGGYRVTGHWQFGSGSSAATLIAGGCFAYEADGTQIFEDGAPLWLFPIMDAADIELLGNWNVAGLQSTASWDYAADDVFVPDARIVPLPTPTSRRPESVYRVGFLSTVYAQHVSFTLGLVRRSFSEIAKVISTKTRVGYEGTIGESQIFLYEFAQHEAQYQAVRAYCRQVFADAQNEPGGPTDLQTARIQVTCAWMTRVSDELIKWCHSWGGSASVRTPNVLARCLNDMSVAINHLYVDRMNLVGPVPPILASWQH